MCFPKHRGNSVTVCNKWFSIYGWTLSREASRYPCSYLLFSHTYQTFFFTDSTTKTQISSTLSSQFPYPTPNSLCTVSVGEAGLPLCVLSVAPGEDVAEMLFMLMLRLLVFLLYEPRWQSVASLSVIASSSPNTWNSRWTRFFYHLYLLEIWLEVSIEEENSKLEPFDTRLILFIT